VVAPFWKGTTDAAVEVADPPVASTMTCVLLMFVELTVPSTRTCWPLVMALFEIEVVLFSYFVEDVSSTVTSSRLTS
jgi:hypothetical protein